MKNMKRLQDILILTILAGLLTAPAWAAGPGELKFDEDSFEVLEEAGTAIVRVERSRGEDGAVSVDYMTTTGGTATAGADYTAVSGTLTWADDDGGDRTFVVPILDDGDGEGRETIELVLSNPTGGAALAAERGTSVLVIRASDGGSGGGGNDDGGDDSDSGSGDGEDSGSGDGEDSDDGEDSGSDDGEDSDSDDGEDSDSDDGEDSGSDDEGESAGTLKFDEASFEVLEGAGVALVTVERSQGEDGEVSVDYFTRDADAADGEDYTAASGTLTWFAGDGADRTFAVPILDDGDTEGDETFELVLENPTGGATIHPTRGTAVVRILANDGGGDDNNDDGGNDDGPNDDGGKAGVLKFGSRTFEALESGGMAIVTVERSQGESGAVSVDYATFDDTAFAGEDYDGVAGTLSWAAGDGGTKTFMVPVADDDLEEGNETVALELSNATGGAEIHATRGSAALTIVDDDATGCAPDDSTMCLAGGRFQVAVDWKSFQGDTGPGRPIALSDQSGLFWFFDRKNVEMLVKVLDACRDFGDYWVFFAATTNVEYEVTVTDTHTGASKTYRNAMGQVAAPVQDTSAFSCN